MIAVIAAAGLLVFLVTHTRAGAPAVAGLITAMATWLVRSARGPSTLPLPGR